MEENIGVVVRVRPIMPHEAAKGETSCVSSTPNRREVRVMTGEHEAQAYVCSKCFPTDTSQEAFFAQSGVVDLLEASMSGFHSCAFAFGQTGAGKTHTVAGPASSLRPGHSSDGILGRSLRHLFARLPQKVPVFIMKISCMEIYHEQVYDLSLPNGGKAPPLQVREHPQDGFYAENCTQTKVESLDDAVTVVDAALRIRHIGAHDMNSRSNRSHFITEIRLELPGDAAEHNVDELGGIDGAEFSVLGKMTIIDLAGSERLKATNSTGAVLQDTGFINRSLYVLGKVIAGLVRNGPMPGGPAAYSNARDVPFRESKLTKLLVGSLGGTSKTLLISCVTEASGSVGETLRTLKFSMTAAKIKNRPIKFLDPQEKLILDLKTEIKRLRDENKFLIVSLMSSQNPMQQQQNAPSSPQAVLDMLEEQRMDRQMRDQMSRNRPQQQQQHKSDAAYPMKNRKYQDLVELKKKRLQKSNAKRKAVGGGGGGGGKGARRNQAEAQMVSPYLLHPGARAHRSEAELPPASDMYRNYVGFSDPSKENYSNMAGLGKHPYAIQSQSAADLARPQYPQPAPADMYVFRTNNNGNNKNSNGGPGPRGGAGADGSNAMFPRSVAAPVQRQPQQQQHHDVATHQQRGAVAALRHQTKAAAHMQSPPPPQQQTLNASVLKQKLAVLKFELEERKQWLEDNPAEATPEKEKQLADLMREVKEMHLEIKLVSQLEGISLGSPPGLSPDKNKSSTSTSTSTSNATNANSISSTSPRAPAKNNATNSSSKPAQQSKSTVGADKRPGDKSDSKAFKQPLPSSNSTSSNSTSVSDTKLPSSFTRAAPSAAPSTTNASNSATPQKASNSSSGIASAKQATNGAMATATSGSMSRSRGGRTRGSAATEDDYGDDDFYGDDEQFEEEEDGQGGSNRSPNAAASNSGKGGGGSSTSTSTYVDDADAVADRALDNVIGRMAPVKSIGSIAPTRSSSSNSSINSHNTASATSPTATSLAKPSGAPAAASASKSSPTKKEVKQAEEEGEEEYGDEGFEEDPYGEEEFEQ